MGVNGEGCVWRRIRNCSGWHRVVWKLWHEYGESRVDEEGLIWVLKVLVGMEGLRWV